MNWILIWLILLSAFALFIFLRYLIPPIVTYKLNDPYAMKPYKHKKAACYDLYAVEDVTIPSNQWREVRTAVIFAPWPHIYFKYLRPWSITPLGNIAYKIHTRSGMAIRKGVRVHLGIIDNDYRNECNPIVFNHNQSYPVRIHRGDRVAQVEFYRVGSPIFVKVNKLSNSSRSIKGHGSSGK